MKKQFDFLDFFLKIDSIYEDGLVNDIKKHKKLYEEAKCLARYNDMTMKDFFESNGYRYITRNIKEVRRELKQEISKYANTNKRLYDLHKLDRNLYFKVMKYATVEEVTVSEYIEMLGFNYSKKDTKITNIKKQLTELYPNKKVEKLSAKNKSLYGVIYRLAQKKNKDINTFIQGLGFVVS